MVMFAGLARVEDRPSQWLPLTEDPNERRAEVAERLRACRVAESGERAPWPAPEVPMCVVDPATLEKAPARLLRRLTAAGWRVVVTHCRGTTFDAQKRPGAVMDSWAIRAARENRRMVAIWWGRAAGRMESRGVLVWGDRPMQWVGIKEFEKGI